MTVDGAAIPLHSVYRLKIHSRVKLEQSLTGVGVEREQAPVEARGDDSAIHDQRLCGKSINTLAATETVAACFAIRLDLIKPAWLTGG